MGLESLILHVASMWAWARCAARPTTATAMIWASSALGFHGPHALQWQRELLASMPSTWADATAVVLAMSCSATAMMAVCGGGYRSCSVFRFAMWVKALVRGGTVRRCFEIFYCCILFS